MVRHRTTPTLALSGTAPDIRVPQTQVLSHVQVTDAPADVLLWVESLFPQASLPERTAPHTTQTDSVSIDALSDADFGPPPSTEEIMETLGKGGIIPEALRRRLEGDAGRT